MSLSSGARFENSLHCDVNRQEIGPNCEEHFEAQHQRSEPDRCGTILKECLQIGTVRAHIYLAEPQRQGTKRYTDGSARELQKRCKEANTRRSAWSTENNQT